MGLDMYVYRLKKLTDAQVKEMTGMLEDEALDKYNILEIPQEKKDSSEILPILSILRPIRMKQKVYNFQKNEEGLRNS